MNPIPRADRRPARLAAAAALLAAVSLLIAGCTIEEPEMPTFTTVVTLPIGNHDITVTELIEDQDYLSATADSMLFFSVIGTTTSVALDTDLSAELTGVDFDASLGDFAIASPAPASFCFRLDEIYPAAASLPPVPIAVPAFGFDLGGDGADLGGIESAVVASGRIELTITNGLPVPVSGDAPPERMTADVIDPRYGTVLVSLDCSGELGPGETRTWSADLAGVHLPGSVGVSLAGGSPGSTAAVTVDPASTLAVNVAVVDLTVAEAEAAIDAQSFAGDAVVALPDSLEIITAEIAGGALDMTLENGLPVPCSVSIACPEMDDASGSPLNIVLDLAAHERRDTRIELAGAGIHAEEAPLTGLTWTVAVASAGSDGAPVTLRATDRLHIQAAPTVLALGEVSGIIPAQNFPIDAMHEQIDIPDELEGLTLAAATLTVEILNDTGVRGAVDLRVEGRNAAGETAVLVTSAEIEARKDEAPARTVVHLDEFNSTITEFLRILPESYDLTGSVRVGGAGLIGTVRPGDSASVSWRIDAPLKVVIDNSEIHRDSEPLDLDEDLREEIEERIETGRILTAIENHFPFDAEIYFQAGPDSMSALDDPDLVIGPLAVAAAAVDPATGFAKGIVESNHDIHLTKSDILVLTSPTAHTAVVARIPGTGGAEVALRTGDYLRVTGAIRAEILVEEDD